MSSTLKVDILQDSGANNIIASDGSGNLTTQKILYPSFLAYLSAEQDVTDAVDTKIQFDTEVYDTDNAYDNSTNYRFTPQVAGKYWVYGTVMTLQDSASNLQQPRIYVYKNGSQITREQTNYSNNNINNTSISTQIVLDLNGSTDYVELYGRVDTVSGGNPSFYGTSSTPYRSYFGAYRIGD